jgi:hypothetical protein
VAAGADATLLFAEVVLGASAAAEGSKSGSRRIIVRGAAKIEAPVHLILRGFVSSHSSRKNKDPARMEAPGARGLGTEVDGITL